MSTNSTSVTVRYPYPYPYIRIRKSAYDVQDKKYNEMPAKAFTTSAEKKGHKMTFRKRSK